MFDGTDYWFGNTTSISSLSDVTSNVTFDEDEITRTTTTDTSGASLYEWQTTDSTGQSTTITPYQRNSGYNKIGNLLQNKLNTSPNVSLEDEVLRIMSRRYFQPSGDDLMFLNNEAYSMAGTTRFTDEAFFEFLQGRMAYEMLQQMFFTMYAASLRSLCASLGLQDTGGTEAIDRSNAIVGEIGTHYFDIHLTLGLWESIQLSINEIDLGPIKSWTV